MYKLKVKMAPDFDDSEEIFESDIRDIANSIPALLSDVEENMVEISGCVISFESSLSKEEIKKLLKDVFSYHFDNVRYESLDKSG